METEADTVEAAQPPAQWKKAVALIAGQGVSLCGDYVLLVALGWTAIQLGGAGAVTALMLAASIPRALMLIFGGAVADSLGPRFVLLRTTSARIALLAAGAAVVMASQALWPLFVVATLEGVLLGLASPSFGTLMPRFATGDQLGRVNSLYATVLRLAPIIGSPIGAWLIATGQPWQAMAVVALTCTVSLICLLYVTKGIPRPAREDDVSLVRRSGDGFRLLATQPRLRWLFVSAFCLDMAFGWPIDVAIPLLVFDNGWGVSAIGLVVAVFAGGALASGTVGALLAHRIPLSIRLVASGVGIAVGIGVMALMPTITTLAAVAFAVGTLSGLNGPAIVTVYQQAAPKARMGAAMALLALAAIGTAPVSIAVFGALAAVIGTQATWIACGGVALLAPVTAALALRSPAPAAEQPVAVQPMPQHAVVDAPVAPVAVPELVDAR